MTVLFADVVHSMDIAAAVGAERLREIMAELVDRSTAVVKRYGGTVGKFTGDGIMAVFGAPVALEDHAVRACLAAFGNPRRGESACRRGRRTATVWNCGCGSGLNSGQVIAGEIGSGALGYTAIGEQVGMAQRMESVAPPGGVMLSASTARLVDSSAAMGEAELVQIKGADEPVAAHRLLGIGDRHRAVGRAESNLVGRQWEMAAAEGSCSAPSMATALWSVWWGHRASARAVWCARWRRWRVAVLSRCSPPSASRTPARSPSMLWHGCCARPPASRVSTGRPPGIECATGLADADPEDLLLLDDLLGIADPKAPLPAIDPDARRRRLTALVNAASLARETPAVYVVEDAHWIDEVSESMLAEFLTVIPQTPSLVLVSYRPEYEGALTRVHGTQTIALEPLGDSETAALVSELLGPDPSISRLGQTIAERAAGNPFFAEEMVRELAERGVLRGNRSAYVSTVGAAEVSVPATVQATIAARIDRLDPAAKRTLSAAAVIGSRFSLDLLETLGIDPLLQDLLGAELIDQVRFTRGLEYVFHHPLIRTVAYESQLKSDRAELHRRLAADDRSPRPGIGRPERCIDRRTSRSRW